MTGGTSVAEACKTGFSLLTSAFICVCEEKFVLVFSYLSFRVCDRSIFMLVLPEIQLFVSSVSGRRLLTLSPCQFSTFLYYKTILPGFSSSFSGVPNVRSDTSLRLA